MTSVPRNLVYKVKKEFLGTLDKIITELPLWVFLGPQHWLVILSPTSSPYIYFDYNVSSGNELNSFLCYTISHLDTFENPIFFNIGCGQYFGVEKMEQIIANCTKCLVSTNLADPQLIRKNLDKIEEELGNYNWSKIITILENKNIIKTVISENENYFDPRKITHIKGEKLKCPLNEDCWPLPQYSNQLIILLESLQ